MEGFIIFFATVSIFSFWGGFLLTHSDPTGCGVRMIPFFFLGMILSPVACIPSVIITIVKFKKLGSLYKIIGFLPVLQFVWFLGGGFRLL